MTMTVNERSTVGKSAVFAGPPPNNKTSGEQAFEIAQLIVEIILLLLKVFWVIGEALFRLVVPVVEKSVKGEIVLITGAGHGIGKELALQYASQGATVVCWDINEKTNHETVKEISKLGYPKAHAYVCNVSNRNNVMDVAKKVQKEVGDISLLINNAGIMPCHSFLEHTVEEIERIMNINVMAHYWILQAFLPAMIKNNHGHIVALSSCAGIVGLRNLVPYCASKFAVRGMMEALFQELRVDPKCQIKGTVIYPYMVNTGLCKKPKMRFQNLMPVLSPEEVAKYIMSAQRRDVLETTIPRSLLSINYYARLFPVKVGILVNDFMDAYVESDL